MYLHKGRLIDWKVMSVWEIIYGIKPEKTQQLNCLAALCRVNGYPIRSLWVGAILRDWSKRKALSDSDYPPYQVQMVEVDDWGQPKAIAFIEERVKIHQMARNKLPECTPEERWERRGESIRCAMYCSAAPFCQQWKDIQNAK